MVCSPCPRRLSSKGSEDAEGAQRTIGFVTDLEGNFKRWRRYVELSQVVQRDEGGKIGLVDGACFVYGGDAVDHFPGDLQLLEELLCLKREYPDRVRLIIGNRDANKLRLGVELTPRHLAEQPLRTHPGCYWTRSSAPGNKLTEAELDEDSAAVRLRWILKYTMGAPNAFESRREELRERGGGAEVSDDLVVASFLESARPGGLVFEYLRHAELAAQVGETLFVHAGLPRRDTVWEPGWTPFSEGLALPDWLEKLDDLRRTALEEVELAGRQDSAPSTVAWAPEGGYGHSQPGSDLCQYGMRDMPGGGMQPSVVYNGWLDNDYRPLQPDEAMLRWLREGGVRRVVSGHLPHGDAPLILRLADDIDAVAADVCYGQNTLWEGEDGEWTEGGEQAVCEVLICPDPAAEASRVHGILSNGRAFEARFDDAFVGSLDGEGWRVKGRLDGQLLLSSNEGWVFRNRLVDASDV